MRHLTTFPRTITEHNGELDGIRVSLNFSPVIDSPITSEKDGVVTPTAPKAPRLTIEEYLARISALERAHLESVLTAIRKVLPEAKERISYGMIRMDTAERHPVYIGAWKKHIGIYPVPIAEGEFERELAPFRVTKDSLHFRYDKPMPLPLIERVATFVVHGGQTA